MTDIAYGLDLSGYSTKDSRLAVARYVEGGVVRIQILRNSAFSKNKSGSDCIVNQIEAESEELGQILKEGVLAVDIPIDLQGLNTFSVPYKRLWEFTDRPADRAFRARPPIADRIGSPVARFQYLLNHTKSYELLGQRLYETYPKASLDIRDLKSEGYKDCNAEWNNEEWRPCFKGGNKNNKYKSESAMQRVLESFCFRGSETLERLDDNDIDAAICAITALAPNEYVISGYLLKEKIHENLRSRELISQKECVKAPQGYVLLGKDNWFEKILVHDTE